MGLHYADSVAIEYFKYINSNQAPNTAGLINLIYSELVHWVHCWRNLNSVTNISLIVSLYNSGTSWYPCAGEIDLKAQIVVFFKENLNLLPSALHNLKLGSNLLFKLFFFLDFIKITVLLTFNNTSQLIHVNTELSNTYNNKLLGM